MAPRFRFAPSPTGEPHIGNLHTALFSWALARTMDGEFVLRIEDTDVQRNTPEATTRMLEALAWLGVEWDEGPDIGGDYAPYLQSERRSMHQQAVEQLLAGDHAYYGDNPRHPASSKGNPLRLRMPRQGHTLLQDAIRGEILFENSAQKDTIIVRSDGSPLYHLASTVDDHHMEITHVVRADEWIASSPIHIQIYRAMGWPEPIWIHLPLVLNGQGQKLKKRDPEGGYQIRDFQTTGYLPEAVFNYLLLLGWAPENNQEIVRAWELRHQFRIERLSASPSIFDWDKLNWVNRQHIRQLDDASLAARIKPYLEEFYDPIPQVDEWLVRLTAAIRDKLVRLEDAIKLTEWAFVDEVEFTTQARHALFSEMTRPVLTYLIAQLAAIVLLDEQTALSILGALRTQFHETRRWTTGQIFRPVRAALQGSMDGPPIHQMMGIIGKAGTLHRLGAALKISRVNESSVD